MPYPGQIYNYSDDALDVPLVQIQGVPTSMVFRLQHAKRSTPEDANNVSNAVFCLCHMRLSRTLYDHSSSLATCWTVLQCVPCTMLQKNLQSRRY